MMTVPYSVLHNGIYLIKLGEMEVRGGGRGGLLQKERFARGGVCAN